MQRDLNNRDFEQFVKQNADQYRMFPSEKVWQNINGALHTRRRWYGAGLALLLLLTGTAVTLVMTSGSGNGSNDTADVLLSPQDILRKEKLIEEPGAFAANHPVFSIPLQNSPESVFPSEPVTITNRASAEPVLQPPVNGIADTDNSLPAATLATDRRTPEPVSNRSIVSGNQNIAGFSFATPASLPPDQTISDTRSQQSRSIIQTEERQTDSYPLTIESVVNSYKPSARRKKATLQFHIAPTISYRKLSENKKFLQSAAANGAIPTYAAYSDINNFVSHKPDMGLELGFTGKYALSQRFKLRAGLQFNVSRYDINAYNYLREDATIALDDAAYGPNHTITKKTNYRNNVNGNSPDSNWLKNLYYSASLPIGAELTFRSSTNAHFGIAATIQPTYNLKNRAYLITTDYKNYVEMPSLVRKWNMNTSFEAFVGYSTGNINWQVGPQIRYQMQSSFIRKYPVKENLFDFGLKVGIQLNR